MAIGVIHRWGFSLSQVHHKYTMQRPLFFYIYSGDGKKFQLTCIIILETACLHFGGILTGIEQFPPKALKLCPSVVSGSSRPHGLEPTRLLCLWDSRGRNTGVGALIPSIQRGAIIHIPGELSLNDSPFNETSLKSRTLVQTPCDRQFKVFFHQHWEGNNLGQPIFPEPPTMPGIQYVIVSNKSHFITD